MKSFAKKAPLVKEAWREAAIVVYTSNNSAFHYGRYASGSDLPEISITAADDEIAGDVEVKWLHGAIARDLKLDINGKFTQATTSFKNFKDCN